MEFASSEDWPRFDDLVRHLQLEPDQVMSAAFAKCPVDRTIHDVHVLHQLFRLNAIPDEAEYFDKMREVFAENQATGDRFHRDVSIGGRIVPSLVDMLTSAAARSRVLGTRSFLRVWAEYAIANGGSPSRRSRGLTYLLTESAESPAGGGPHEMPALLEFLETLRDPQRPELDFQYLLALDEERLAFLQVSLLGDVVQKSSFGGLTAQRALLTHWREQFGLFTHGEIEELESLINDMGASENEFQRFFDRHPHFLRTSDYREVYSHVYLTHQSSGALVPDFILTDRELAKAAVIELKLPRPKLIRRQRNRDRFSAAICEARAQLLRYREWFRIPSNRQQLKSVVGMEIYEPRLAVIIGRSAEFRDDIDRQLLAASQPEIEVVTYDDILAYARRRRVSIGGAA